MNMGPRVDVYRSDERRGMLAGSVPQRLDEVYVPVGCGSGICGVIAWRDEVRAALRDLYRCTHNIAEGAGAAPLAALLKNPQRHGKRFAVILSGGNIDRELYMEALGRS